MMLQPLRVLTDSDMEEIHDGAARILEDVGVKIEHEKALGYLQDFGCLTDRSTYRVKFPRKLTDACVERMHRDYGNPSRVPHSMAVRYSHVRFRREPYRIHPDFTVSAGGFCRFIYDLSGVRRTATLDDVRRAIHLADELAEIEYTGLPVSDQETPYHLRPVKMAAELATYTRKFGGIETFSPQDIPYLIDIGCVIKGSLDALKKEPILVGYAEARSPLCIDRNMAGIFIEYIERGFPQTLDTMPCGGATAPVTAAGTLALAVAETLAGVILAYSVDENAVVGVDIIPSNFDMTHGTFRYASADRIPLLMARVQMVSEFYGCPSGVHGGKTDSCAIDVQCGIEKATTTIFPVLAGAVGIGTVGHLENAMTFSPVQLVLDNEIAGSVRRTLKPLAVNSETIALDVVREVGPGGHFLDAEHTLQHYREELFNSKVLEAMPWEAAASMAAPGAKAKAEAIARSIWETDPIPILADDQVRELEKIVRNRANHGAEG